MTLRGDVDDAEVCSAHNSMSALGTGHNQWARRHQGIESWRQVRKQEEEHNIDRGTVCMHALCEPLAEASGAPLESWQQRAHESIVAEVGRADDAIKPVLRRRAFEAVAIGRVLGIKGRRTLRVVDEHIYRGRIADSVAEPARQASDRRERGKVEVYPDGSHGSAEPRRGGFRPALSPVTTIRAPARASLCALSKPTPSLPPVMRMVVPTRALAAGDHTGSPHCSRRQIKAPNGESLAPPFGNKTAAETSRGPRKAAAATVAAPPSTSTLVGLGELALKATAPWTQHATSAVASLPDGERRSGV